MSKATVLKLHGKPLELNPAPPLARKIKTYLEGLGDDQLRTSEQVCQETGTTLRTLRSGDYGQHLGAYHQFCTRFNCNLWGNPRAIAELKRQLGVRP